MRPSHVLLAVGIALVWGVNFVVMKVGLQTLPPFFFAFARFLLAAVPLVFFYRRPAVPWRLLCCYGLAQFAGQFAFLFLGLRLGMPAGLSSAVVQLQAFFTIGVAAWLLHERPRPTQVCAALIGFSGIGVVASHVEGRATLIGLVLVVLAAISWAFGNVFTKRIAQVEQAAGRGVDVMPVVAWASLIACVPLLALSLAFEGPAAIAGALRSADPRSVGAVVFNAYVVTTFGFGAWSFLMRRYSTAVVAPFALLVPIAGMGSAAILLGEALHGWMLAAAALVIAGLALNQHAATRPVSAPRR